MLEPMACHWNGRALFTASLALALVACGGGTSDPDAGNGVACGAVTCGAGQVCCNASCGICTAPGETCTEQVCSDAGTHEGSDAGSDAGHTGSDAGVECGSATCAPGELCCPGCGGAMTCEAAASCPDVMCEDTCDPSDPCDEESYCDTPESTCGNGTCKPRPTGCTSDCPGVCGCDGESYCNVCVAQANGTDVAPDGSCGPRACIAMDARGDDTCTGELGFAYDGTRCVGIHCTCEGEDCDSLFPTSDDCEAAYAHCRAPESCGGFIGLTCSGPGTYCDYPDGAECGIADASGTCQPRPDDCTGQPDAPVCGCDGTTYDNPCEAHRNGVDDASSGACSDPPADCRTTGCEHGSTCTACFSGWICLAEGMVCAF